MLIWLETNLQTLTAICIFLHRNGDSDMKATQDTRVSGCKKTLHLLLLTDYTKVFDCMNHNKLWKILTEMGIPDHLTCLLRDPYAAQEATVRTGHGTTDWFQIGKGVGQGCHPAYLIDMQSTSCKMLDWMKHKLESRLPGEISITSDMQMTPPLWQKAKN